MTANARTRARVRAPAPETGTRYALAACLRRSQGGRPGAWSGHVRRGSCGATRLSGAASRVLRDGDVAARRARGSFAEPAVALGLFVARVARCGREALLVWPASSRRECCERSECSDAWTRRCGDRGSRSRGPICAHSAFAAPAEHAVLPAVLPALPVCGAAGSSFRAAEVRMPLQTGSVVRWHRLTARMLCRDTCCVERQNLLEHGLAASATVPHSRNTFS